MPNSSTQTPPARIPGCYQGPTPKKFKKKKAEKNPPWMSDIKGHAKKQDKCACVKCQLDSIKQFGSNHDEMAKNRRAKGLPVFDTSLVSRFQFQPLSRTLCLTDHLALSHWSKYWPQTDMRWDALKRWAIQSINTNRMILMCNPLYPKLQSYHV